MNRASPRGARPGGYSRSPRAGLCAAVIGILALACQATAVAGSERAGLYFHPNAGQTAAEVAYLAHGPGYQVFLTAHDITILTKDRDAGGVVKLAFRNANPAPEIVGEGVRAGRVSYLRGADAATWQTDLPTYHKIRYRSLYDGIDLLVREHNGELEYDFVVAPYADPGQIRMAIVRGHDSRGDVVLDADGALRVPLGGATTEPEHVRLSKPFTYQVIDGAQREVASGYRLHPTQRDAVELTFAVAQYDRAQTLVIDPVLSASTYLGGFGQDAGTSVATDAAGAAYLFGATAAPNFPTLNPLQASPGGGGAADAYVAKFAADGTTLLYATYLGGDANDVAAAGGNARGAIKVDSQGNAVVASVTSSSDFPVVNALQAAKGGGAGSFLDDGFVAKLNATGTALLFSTYLGGGDSDSVLDLDLDGQGNVYLTGITRSDDFPTTAGALQGSLAFVGSSDAFVSIISADGSTLSASTYLGGGNGILPTDEGTGVEVDAAGNVFVAGNTGADDFPLQNPIQTGSGADFPAFVAKLAPDLGSLIYGTLITGGEEETAYGLALDASGAAFLVGTTESPGFPTTAGAFQTTFAGDRDAFLVKINPAGNAFAYATLLGGSGADDGFNGTMDVEVNDAGQAFIVGTTDSVDLPLANPTQADNAGAEDLFVAKFDATGSSLLFGTYFGGGNTDISGGLALDGNGDVFLTGTTFSTDFPLMQAFQSTLGISGTDAVFAKLLDDDAGFATNIVAAVLPGTRVGEVGSTVTAFVTILNAGSVAADGCFIENLSSVPVDFSYQATDALNAPIGNANVPTSIAPGAGQSFVVSFAVNAAFPLTDIALGFNCSNAAAAPASPANAFQLTGSANASADVIALAATLNNDGIVRLDQDSSGIGATLGGVFSVSTVNVGGAGDEFTVSADSDPANTGSLVTTFVCQTDPGTGACLAAPSASVTLMIGPGETPTFGLFPSTIGPGAGGPPVVFDPSLNRVFVRLTNSSSTTTTATSVAVTTE